MIPKLNSKLSEGDLKKYYKRGINQVFFLASRVTLPFFFSYHVWIITCDKKNKISRWESWHVKNVSKKSWGSIQLNLFNFPETGMNIYQVKKQPRFKSKIIKYLEGHCATKIINFLEKKAKFYPYKNYKYNKYPGPNSNTFPQWVINNLPKKCQFKLPWQAIGKNYIKHQ